MTPSVEQYAAGTYGFDAAIVKKYQKDFVELKDDKGLVKVLISTQYQGRVMTSTLGGDSGTGFGWVNHKLIEAQQKLKQFNPVGGEERFWLGPEGGQFALYFSAGDSFNIKNWQVPPVLDTLPYSLVTADRTTASFYKEASLVNYAGTRFDIAISRKIRLLENEAIGPAIRSVIPPGIRYMGFETDNQIKNRGQVAWKKETGLLSIWLLGMMNPSEKTVVIIPFKPGPDAHQHISDNYFGKVPSERLQVKDSLLFFKCDGRSRGKIGLSPRIAGSLAASYDFQQNTLSLLLFDIDREGLYVNSKWEIQQYPYRGDVVNSYNDGPLADGSQMGPFYEIESSSAARELKPGESQVHKQITCHFQGDYPTMRRFVAQLLSVDLEDLKNM